LSRLHTNSQLSQPLEVTHVRHHDESSREQQQQQQQQRPQQNVSITAFTLQKDGKVGREGGKEGGLKEVCR